jgi:hypothetical protein
MIITITLNPSIDRTLYLGKLEKDILDLYDNYQDSVKQNNLLIRKNREMEYGLRVAEKALKNSLALTKELIQD